MQQTCNLSKNIHYKEDDIMSAFDLSLKFSHFNIKINIDSDEDRKKEKIAKRIAQEMALDHVMEERNQILSSFDSMSLRY